MIAAARVLGALVLLGSGSAAAAAVPVGGAPVPKDMCEAPGACGTIRGFVRAAGTRTAMAEVGVIVVPASDRRLPARADPASDRPRWIREVRTGSDGSLALVSPPGLVRVVIVAPGFERFEAVLEVPRGGEVVAKLFPRPLGLNPYRTVVKTANEPTRAPTVAARTLSREEISTLPGSQGDPLRALQNLPGVARTPGGLGLLVLRGANPNQSLVFVGEHPVPRAFHVLSLASVVPADAIERLDFVPGNFDSRYGNATGGVVVIEPRRGRRDGVHGFAKVDLTAAGAMVEGALGTRGGSFIVGGQRGYVDGVLLAAQKLLGEQDFLLPRYYDYQAMIDHPLPGGASITARVIGSGDRIRLRRDGEPAFDFRADWHRFDVVYRRRSGPWRVMVSPAFRYDIGERNLPAQDSLQHRRDFVTSLRGEAARELSQRFMLVFGTDLQVDAFSARTMLPASSGVPGETMAQEAKGTETWLGAYATAHLRLGSLLLTPGVRASGFVVGSATAYSIDPRINARVDVGDRWNVRFAVGVYSRPSVRRYAADGRLVPGGARLGSDNLILPNFFANFEPIVVFEPLEDTLRVARALQASATAQHDFLAGYTAELTGFWREQNDGTPPEVLGQVLPGTRTRNYGLELLLRKPLTRRLYGWVAYTLMRSQLFTEARGPLEAQRFTADFDQRHNLAVIASYKLPNNWQIGGRFRLVSGTPYTPVLGSVQYEGSYLPITGLYNSARFPPFHQLDLRVDKRWILRRASVTAYLDVQNVYNRANVEAYIYNYDFSSAAGGVGLPIFPSLGLRVDF